MLLYPVLFYPVRPRWDFLLPVLFEREVLTNRHLVKWKWTRSKLGHLWGLSHVLCPPLCSFLKQLVCTCSIWWWPFQLHVACFFFLPWGKASGYSKHAIPGSANRLCPMGQSLADKGQELVHPLGRCFWSSFYTALQHTPARLHLGQTGDSNILCIGISQSSVPILGIVSLNKQSAPRLLFPALPSGAAQPKTKPNKPECSAFYHDLLPPIMVI